MEDWERRIETIQNKDDMLQLIRSHDILSGDIQMIWTLVVNRADKLSFKALWFLDYLQSKYPNFIEPIIDDICVFLLQCPDISKRRLLCKILSQCTIPTHRVGKIYEQVIRWIDSPQQPVAVRVHAMEIAINIVSIYPELQEELLLILQNHYNHGSPGFKSRCRKVFKRLGKTNLKDY